MDVGRSARSVGDDEALWLELMKDMSWATRYKRGARRVEDLTPEDARRAVSPDPAKEIALVAVAAHDRNEKMAGVVRATEIQAGTWEFALVVLDAWQRRGVGRRLMIALMDALAGTRRQSARGRRPCVEPEHARLRDTPRVREPFAPGSGARQTGRTQTAPAKATRGSDILGMINMCAMP